MPTITGASDLLNNDFFLIHNDIWVTVTSNSYGTYTFDRDKLLKVELKTKINADVPETIKLDFQITSEISQGNSVDYTFNLAPALRLFFKSPEIPNMTPRFARIGDNYKANTAHFIEITFFVFNPHLSSLKMEAMPTITKWFINGIQKKKQRINSRRYSTGYTEIPNTGRIPSEFAQNFNDLTSVNTLNPTRKVRLFRGFPQSISALGTKLGTDEHTRGILFKIISLQTPAEPNHNGGTYNSETVITTPPTLVFGTNAAEIYTPKCGSTYLRWVNKLGGVSYWAFEGTYIENSKTAPRGYINRDNVNLEDHDPIHQYGSTLDVTFDISTDVPNEFFVMMTDLAESPLIQLFSYPETKPTVNNVTFEHNPFVGAYWTRIIPLKNKLKFNDKQLHQNVSFSFKYFDQNRATI